MKAILKKFLAVFLVAAMLFGAGQSLALGISASAAGADGTLSIATRFFRQVEATEEWVETERVAKGENVKARAYIGTDYYTNSGELMFFYDADFFTDTYARDTINQCTVNPVYADLYGLEAQAVVCSNDSRIVQRILEYGLVTEEFINEHVCIAVLYMFATDTANMMLEIDEWLVEFDLTVLESDLAQSGDFFALDTTVQSIANPYGYINVPWGKAGEYAENTIILADKDVAVEIQSTPVYSYSNLTFDASGGYFADTGYTDRYEATGNIREDFYLGDVPIPEREGYVFVGWSYDGTLEALVESIVTVDYEDMRFVAVWESVECIIYFDTMCDIVIDPVIAAYDSMIELPEVTREGYIFDGWVDANGARVESPYVATDYEVTLTAQWVVNIHQIVFNANGGKFDNGTDVLFAEFAYGDEILFPEEPSREGYAFVGWVDDYGASVDTSVPMPDMSMNINAVWETLEFTVTYETFTDETVPSAVYRYGDYVELPAYVVKEGYIFAGWSFNGEIIYDSFYMPAEDVTVVAEWIAADDIPYTVEVYVEDREFGQFVLDMNNTKVYYGTADTEIYIEEYPEITGFTFEPAISITSAVINPDGSTVLKLYYTRNRYPMVLYSDGAELLTEEYLFGIEVAEPAYPEREGYQCIGWMFKETGEKVAFPISMPADLVELEAIWEAEEYTIEFNTNGGDEMEPVTARYGDEITLESPVRENHQFVGWRAPDGKLYFASQQFTVPAEDVTLTAVWMVRSHTVTYYVGGREFKFTVACGSEVPMPDLSDMQNAEILCWLDSNGKETEIPDIMPDNSLTFTAKVKYSCGGNKYGVTASYESGCFDHEGDDIRFVVEEVTGRREPGGVYFKGENYKQISLYNIKFYYGDVQIQPKNGKVEICIPVPEAYKNSTDFLVIHRFSEGGYEELSAAKKNGKLVFLTGSFSDFEIYVKSETAIKTKPSKLSYNYKEALDLSGLTLEAVDENGNKTVVSDTSKMTVKGYDPKKIGTQTLTVEYDGTSVQFNVTISYAWWQMLIRILLLGFLWY